MWKKREETSGSAGRQSFAGNTSMGAEGVFECAFKVGVMVADQQAIFLHALGEGPFEIDRIPLNRNYSWLDLRRRRLVGG